MDKIAVASNKKILLDVVDQFYSIFSFEKASLVLGEDFIRRKNYSLHTDPVTSLTI